MRKTLKEADIYLFYCVIEKVDILEGKIREKGGILTSLVYIYLGTKTGEKGGNF